MATMHRSLPYLRALVASGDCFDFYSECERLREEFIRLIDVAECAHDYVNLVRPAFMDAAEWDDLKAMHARKLKDALAGFGFA